MLKEKYNDLSGNGNKRKYTTLRTATEGPFLGGSGQLIQATQPLVA